MKRYTFSSQRTINDDKDSRGFQQPRSRSQVGKEAVARLASTGENDDFLPGRRVSIQWGRDDPTMEPEFGRGRKNFHKGFSGGISRAK